MTQKEALQILKSGKNCFITGEPGSGKTYTINMFTEWLRSQGKRYAVTASTGIAATHINGTTIHSFSGIGIKDVLTEADIATILTKDYVVRKVQAIDVLIIDEISMLSAQVLDNVDKVLRAIRRDQFETVPFGGVQVIFVGDFFQLPPVSGPGKPKAEFSFEAQSWKDADPTICYLTEQHRQSDQKFLEILTAMRSGTMKPLHKKHLADTGAFDRERPATRLFTHNLDVDRINDMELLKIDGEEREYEMKSSGIPFLVQTLKKQCLSPELLVLRVGAVVMFTRNNFEQGYVNGTIGKVIEYASNGMPVVELKDGSTVVASYAEWSIEDTKAVISQVPLRLAWAITVHKSQGMSLDAASIDLSKAFEYGQGYVAISRVRTLDGLYLEGINDRGFEMHPQVVEKDAWFRYKSINVKA